MFWFVWKWEYYCTYEICKINLLNDSRMIWKIQKNWIRTATKITTNIYEVALKLAYILFQNKCNKSASYYQFMYIISGVSLKFWWENSKKDIFMGNFTWQFYSTFLCHNLVVLLKKFFQKPNSFQVEPMKGALYI